MNEIRFGDSIDRVQETFDEWHRSPFLTKNRCDRCHVWGPGFFNWKTREFTCLNCKAIELFESMVGKKEET